jgi:flavorubredoxin
MFTYLVEEQLLFSNDAFGQHIASSSRFDDELGLDEAMGHAQKFYANLLVPLAPKVRKKLDEVAALGLEIRTIAPSHGVIWRSNAGAILEAYANWSGGLSKDKVTIVFDTMHGSTAALANALAEGVMDEGYEVKVHRLGATHRSDIVIDVLDSKAVLVGSPTIADTLYPSLGDFLAYLSGLQPGRLGEKKRGFAFGSHGGRGGAVHEVSEWMRKAGIDVVDDGIEVTFRPTKEDLAACVERGRSLVQDLRQR